MEAVYNHLVTVLIDKFEVDAEQIRPEVSLAELELDSLAVVELYVTLQEHWGSPLEEDESAGELPLRDFAAAVASQVSPDRGAADPETAR